MSTALPRNRPRTTDRFRKRPSETDWHARRAQALEKGLREEFASRVDSPLPGGFQVLSDAASAEVFDATRRTRLLAATVLVIGVLNAALIAFMVMVRDVTVPGPVLVAALSPLAAGLLMEVGFGVALRRRLARCVVGPVTWNLVHAARGTVENIAAAGGGSPVRSAATALAERVEERLDALLLSSTPTDDDAQEARDIRRAASWLVLLAQDVKSHGADSTEAIATAEAATAALSRN